MNSIPVPYSTRPPLCNTWLVDGAEPALIDAGLRVPDQLDDLARRLGGRPLSRLLITHGHPDHVSAVDAVRARWPNVMACRWSDGDSTAWQRLADGDRVRAGNAMLTVLHTPGHAPDHLCFWDGESQAVYTGDMIVQGTTVMVPGLCNAGSWNEAIASLPGTNR